MQLSPAFKRVFLSGEGGGRGQGTAEHRPEVSFSVHRNMLSHIVAYVNKEALMLC